MGMVIGCMPTLRRRCSVLLAFVLVLAGIFALFGKSLLMVQIVQYLMSAVTAAIVYLISQRLFGVKLVSLTGSFSFSISPSFNAVGHPRWDRHDLDAVV